MARNINVLTSVLSIECTHISLLILYVCLYQSVNRQGINKFQIKNIKGRSKKN